LVVGEIIVGGTASNIALSALMSRDREWSVGSMYKDRSHVRSAVTRKGCGYDVTTEVGSQTATVILVKVFNKILVSDFDSCEMSCLGGGGVDESNGDGTMESSFLLKEEISCEAKKLVLIRAMFDPDSQLAGHFKEEDKGEVMADVPRLHDERWWNDQPPMRGLTRQMCPRWKRLRLGL